jgi:uracil-DNA glycosylase
MSKRPAASSGLDRLLIEIRACEVCAAHLPLGPRPVVRAGGSARILIVGQAPGARVRESGVPWDDASGARLKGWLGLPDAVFYDRERVALMPMGFCYPGRAKSGGDNPPRPECAPLWHARLIAEMPRIRLTLLVGSYAQRAYAAPSASSMTERVRTFVAGADHVALPHPSWRIVGWMRRNPWFESDILPALRGRIAAALA